MKGRWPLIGLSYLLAAIIFAANELPWGVLWFKEFHLDHPLLMRINWFAHYFGPVAFLAWCAVAFVVLRRYRRGGLWLSLGAPFALETFVRVVLYVVGATIYYSLPHR